MMPPNCCLCDNGIETGHQCELIYFSKTESDQQWHAMAATETGFTGHPPDCDWFCAIHTETAKSFIHVDLATALRHLRENESWQLIYIDLFDRDTPPSVQRSGVGFESGFEEFWDRILATTEADGRRYPSDYRLSFQSNHTDYSLPRECMELTLIKQNIPDGEKASQAIKLLSAGQAAQMRKGGITEVKKYLAGHCRQLSRSQK